MHPAPPVPIHSSTHATLHVGTAVQSEPAHSSTVNSSWKPETPAWVLVPLEKHLGDWGGGGQGTDPTGLEGAEILLDASSQLQKLKDPKTPSSPNSAFLSLDTG